MKRRHIIQKSGTLLLGMCLVGGLVSGCVSTEKYEAEKSRALNFQRLLKQEEKRTGELNVQVQESQQQLSKLEGKNRDLSLEVNNLQEEVSKLQVEADQSREAESSSTDLADETMTLSEQSLDDFGLGEMDFGESDFTNLEAETPISTSTSHTVSKGETLYRLSREYGVTVDDLKRWNDLSSNLISIGQELIVSEP